MPEHVDSPIGPLEVVEEDSIRLVVVGSRRCRKCGAPLPREKIGVGWVKVFVRECYNYCCSPCCPHSDEDPCPKERNEEIIHKPFYKPIVTSEVDAEQN